MGANAEPFDPGPRRRIQAARQDEESRSEAFQPRKSEVVGDREAGGEPFSFAVFAQHAHSMRPLRPRLRPSRPHSDGDPALLHRFESEERSQQPCSSGSEKAGNAEDLTPMKREGSLSRSKVVHLQQWFTGFSR